MILDSKAQANEAKRATRGTTPDVQGKRRQRAPYQTPAPSRSHLAKEGVGTETM